MGNSKWLKGLKIAASCLAIGFLLGVALGKYNSPKWSDPETTLLHMRTMMIVRYPEGDRVVLSTTCRTDLFTYDSAFDTLVTSFVSFDSLALIEAKRSGTSSELTSLMQLIGLPISGLTLATVGKDTYTFVGELSSNWKVVATIIAAAAVASGVGLGYMVAYDDAMPCNDGVVRSVLNDKKVWRRFADTAKRTRGGVVVPLKQLERLGISVGRSK